MEKQRKDSLSIYYCGREQCQPDHFWGPAVRPHYLLHVVLNGKGIFRYRQKTWQLSTGDAFLIHPMETHFYQADRKDPWEYAWVGFDGLSVQSILDQTALGNSPVYLSPEPACCHPILELNSAFQKSERNHLELVSDLLLVFSRMPVSQKTLSISPEEQYYQTALNYIQNNYSYDLKIQDIAAFVGIDRTYLYKIFMKESGISPKKYLMQFRIRLALNLLQTQKYTITETAFSCGFRDTPAFSAAFRKQMGITPKQYKENPMLWK